MCDNYCKVNYFKIHVIHEDSNWWNALVARPWTYIFFVFVCGLIKLLYHFHTSCAFEPLKPPPLFWV